MLCLVLAQRLPAMAELVATAMIRSVRAAILDDDGSGEAILSSLSRLSPVFVAFYFGSRLPPIPIYSLFSCVIFCLVPRITPHL